MIDTYGFYAFSKRKNKDHTHIELEEQKVPMLRKTVSCDDSKMIYQNDITKNGNNHFHVAETEVVSTLDLFFFFFFFAENIKIKRKSVTLLILLPVKAFCCLAIREYLQLFYIPTNPLDVTFKLS